MAPLHSSLGDRVRLSQSINQSINQYYREGRGEKIQRKKKGGRPYSKEGSGEEKGGQRQGWKKGL